MYAIEKIQAGFKITVSLTAVLTTFYTAVEFMSFLSSPSNTNAKTYFRGDYWVSASWSLFINQILLSLFVLQHSALALPQVKNWLSTNLKLQVLQRSVYILLTSLTLQVVLKYWRSIPEVTLWNVNTNVKLYWWSFFTLHAFAWAIIYVGCICMDVNELLGIKQVYYSIQHLPDPNSYKSRDLQRLYEHMRHPSFIGLLVIFWAIPCMSLDRLLLAFVWSAYMYLSWNTDKRDYQYQSFQLERKYHEFNYVK